MFPAIKQTRFAKRIIKRLLKSHKAVSREDSTLSGEALYKKVLLHAEYADLASVDKVLEQARDSVDLWTTSMSHSFGFRQLAHFVVMSEYRAAGNVGTVISVRDICYSLISTEL
jgi:hypothetical protein